MYQSGHGQRSIARWLLSLASVALLAAACGTDPLRPEPGALNRAPPDLLARLRADPFTYFRFVNRSWIARVCDVFASDLRELPVVRLHGDAHVEQYAFTADAWGLDDFDDSARGPAAVDIVRFLGSIDLAARGRGWTGHQAMLFDRFLEAYRRGLAEPDNRPPQPEIVRRLRPAEPATRAAFLAWGETQMQPMAEESMKAVVAAMENFGQFVQGERPELAPGYFRVSRLGWLRMGIGSAVHEKILIRVEGPSADPADDELLEAKELGNLGGLECLEALTSPPTLRVVTGSRQLGRLKHNILAAGPELVIPEVVARGQQRRDWWIRSWDPSYREIRLNDLRSVDDLLAIIDDSGVQLGAGSLHEQTGPEGDFSRKQALASIARFQTRFQREAAFLIDDLLRGWRELQ